MSKPDLIDTILPASRIHLLGGHSNVGKTRFLLPFLLEWQAGNPVLGHASNPVPWAYVVGDRFLAEAEDTCRSMGIDPERIPMIGAFGDQDKSWLGVIKEATARKVGLLVWEGFTDFCPLERKKEIRDFISSVGAYCCRPEFHNGSLTILGVAESPKLKPGDRYDDPRQRISGFASWGYHTSSVLLIENECPANIEATERILHCSLKNAPSFTMEGQFNDRGHLEFTKKRELLPEKPSKFKSRFDIN